ncbi:hypothetical protein [Acidihalobacter prosperus]|uniref:DUF4412 domain-containing protein n=1 Tax=Acidihalobacter prosperus TaxID=160660 RepID=A0A1A6C0A0_9GAMM|nr:hypothetical protein [Acidihalobacter prosperus]OBS07984.1 hypothetical protein Thpro_022234 [Acidihalobacter prosperus]
MTNRILLAAILVSMAGTSAAGTVIESRAADGVTRITLSGDHARIDAPDPRGAYTVVDFKSARLYMVDTGKHEIYDAGTLSAADAKAPPGMRLKATGAGDRIAGYATRAYRLEVNGRHCATYALAAKPLKDRELRRFAEFFVHHNTPEAALAYKMQESICERARKAADVQLIKQGLPLRTVDENGRSDEIVSIRTDVHVPASRFALPKGYKRIDVAEEMRSAGEMHGAPGGAMSPQQRQELDRMMQEQLKQMTPEQRKMFEQMMQQHQQ